MDYIKQHRIHILFEKLAGTLLAAQPEKPIQFLIHQLQQLQGDEQPNGVVEAKVEVPSPSPPAHPAAPAHPPAQPNVTPPAPVVEATKEKKKITMSVFGLDAAGKTTLVYAIGGEPTKSTTPTVGFTPTWFRGEEWDLQVYDLGGGKKIRGIWNQYFSDVHGIIFVVDSADPGRFQEAKKELEDIMSDERAKGKPLLVFANKQDMSSAKTAMEIEKVLELHGIEHHVFGCSAIANPVDDNIEKGMEWVLGAASRCYEELNARIKVQLEADQQRRKKEMEEQKKRVAAYKQEQERAAANSAPVPVS